MGKPTMQTALSQTTRAPVAAGIIMRGAICPGREELGARARKEEKKWRRGWEEGENKEQKKIKEKVRNGSECVSV